MDYKSIKKSVMDAAQSVGDVIADAARKPVDIWNDANTGTKIGAAAAAGGLAIISAPLLGASFLGASLAAAIGGVINNKFADDPELVALKNNYAALEDRVRTQFAVMEKISKGEFGAKASGAMDEEMKASLKANCKHAYETYAKASEKVATLMKDLEKSGKYDSKELRKISALIEVADDEIRSVGDQLKDCEII